MTQAHRLSFVLQSAFVPRPWLCSFQGRVLPRLGYCQCCIESLQPLYQAGPTLADIILQKIQARKMLRVSAIHVVGLLISSRRLKPGKKQLMAMVPCHNINLPHCFWNDVALGVTKCARFASGSRFQPF